MYTKLMFVVWLSLIACVYSLQINLKETEERLDPQLENHLFQHHPQRPNEYQVLRGNPIRRKRSIDDDHPAVLSVSVSVKGQELNLILTKANIADPELTLEVPGEENYEAIEEYQPASLDCIYSGGDDSHWVIISMCTGLNGVIKHGEKAYQLEQISEDDQLLSRHKMEKSDHHLFVTYPIDTERHLQTFEQSSKSKTVQRPMAKVTGEKVGAGIRRKRRAANKGPYTVELAIFVDQNLYQYVKKRFPGANQKEKTVDIIMTLVNAVHRLYSHPSLGDNKIEMLVKKAKVIGADDVAYAKGDIYKYLKNFCNWQNKKNPKGKGNWDHALLLSGHDLWSDYPHKNSTVGLAFVGGMCSSKYSCTINEATTFAAAFIIAHEMGHNLNMVHDGGPGASKCDENKFIMSSVMASGATTWSQCSKDSLSSFLKSRGSCLTAKNTRTGDKKSHEGKLPGQRFNADQQCSYMYGKGWAHFKNSEPPFNNVCREIWCRKNRLLRTPSASALEGTSCGKNKICRHSKCADENPGDTKAQPATEKSPPTVSTKDSNNILFVVPTKDGEASKCRSDCTDYTINIFGSVMSNIFQQIAKAMGFCEEECE